MPLNISGEARCSGGGYFATAGLRSGTRRSGRCGDRFAGGGKTASILPVERRRDLSNFVFWTLAEYCVEFKLPFDLMIGVNRAVYPAGVFQGMDLYDSRVSLIQQEGIVQRLSRR